MGKALSDPHTFDTETLIVRTYRDSIMKPEHNRRRGITSEREGEGE